MVKFTFEEGVKLKFEVEPGGKENFEVSATSNTALVKGLCRMVEESAGYMKMTKQDLLCRLAVVLMGTKEEAAEC